MKKLLLNLLALGLALSVSAQDKIKSIYQESIDLLSKQDAAKNYIITDDLAKSFDNLYAGSAPTAAQLKADLDNDPFFKGHLQFTIGDNAKDKVATHGAFDDFGSTNVTNIANAVSSLMIDRAKQELTLAFFNKLQAVSKKYPEFQTLFPQTFDRLNNLLTYSYPKMLPALRDAFLSDLQKLSVNIEAMFALPKYKTLMDNFPEINVAVQIFKVIHQIESGVSPDKVIQSIDTSVNKIVGDPAYKSFVTLDLKNMAATVHFARMFSDALRNPVANKTIWINGVQAQVIIADEAHARSFFGLLWLQATNDKNAAKYYIDKTSPGTATSIADLLGNNADNIILLQNRVTSFIDAATKAETAILQVRNVTKKGSVPSQDDYYNAINSSLDVVDNGFSLVKLLDKNLAVDDYLTIARQTNNVYKDIYSKQYTAAVSDGLDVIDGVAQMIKSHGNVKIATSKNSDSFESSSKDIVSIVGKIKPYAILIANIAEAKTEDDIKSALNNAILPVGSSSIKKNTANNLSIQTYLGTYYSTRNFQPDAIRSWSDKFGVYGPIGLSYTPGIFSWGKGGSLSIFGSVFDLGAIIDYKLKQDPSTTTSTNTSTSSTATKQYSINLGQIFSPGVHLVYGLFENIPLSIGFGAQYGPGLSKIDATGTTNVINPTWRFNAFLAVDLPFFNLINKTKTGK